MCVWGWHKPEVLLYLILNPTGITKYERCNMFEYKCMSVCLLVSWVCNVHSVQARWDWFVLAAPSSPPDLVCGAFILLVENSWPLSTPLNAISHPLSFDVPLSLSHIPLTSSKAFVKALLFGTLSPCKEDQYANQSSGEWAEVAAGRISEQNWCVITVRARLNPYLLAKCSIRLCVSAWGSLGDEQGLSNHKHAHTSVSKVVWYKWMPVFKLVCWS